MRFWIYNINRRVVDYLGQLFGKRKLQAFFYSLVYPLVKQWDDYDAWRRGMYYLINVNSQVFKLRNYLNDRYDPNQRRIYIGSVGPTGDGVYVALESEGNPFLEAGLEGAGEGGVFVATESESRFKGLFTVHLPLVLKSSEAQIKSTVNSVKLAGKQFQIEYF